MEFNKDDSILTMEWGHHFRTIEKEIQSYHNTRIHSEYYVLTLGGFFFFLPFLFWKTYYD